MKRLIIISSLLLVMSSCKHTNSLRYLDEYTGKRPASAGLWDSEPLHSQLKDLTGDQFDQFIKYMKDAVPLAKDKYFFTYSLISQDSTRGLAYILVDADKSKILAGITTNYQIQKFQSPGEAFTLPAPLQSRLDSLEK
jgi:hypothetical protein